MTHPGQWLETCALYTFSGFLEKGVRECGYHDTHIMWSSVVIKAKLVVMKAKLVVMKAKCLIPRRHGKMDQDFFKKASAPKSPSL